MKRIALFFLFCCLFAGSLPVGAQDKLYPNEFPMGDVQLLDGPFKRARDLNLNVLLMYDVDRLMAPYLKEAGLPKKADSYPNWDGLDGHVGGHYLTAMAFYYASTGDLECKKRMEYMIAELNRCQEAHAAKHPQWGIGYAGGFPNSATIWSAFQQLNFGPYNGAWAPFYNLHKMYAGLRDAWAYCGNEDAKAIFLKFCDWGISITEKLNDQQMQSVLNMEHGGMNETFADAYLITGDVKYLRAAEKYSHRQILDPMAQHVDNLDNKHANTQIPKAVGFARIAELSHAPTYVTASRFFWETITGTRTLAHGGNSRREHFPSADACMDYVNDVDGPESCNTNNMLKLTENLFRMDPKASYVDYYERALYNHILSTQHPEHGGYVYFTTSRPRHYRSYSAPNSAMWCCVGTGMENHGKYNQFIYTRRNDSLYVNLFIASELNWRDKQIGLRQDTRFPDEEATSLTITKGSGKFSLMLRYPVWVSPGALKVTVNGKAFSYTAKPSSFICIARSWKKGDVVKVELPMHNHVEHLPNVPQYIAFMHGPILLGAKTGTEDMRGIIADDSRFGQYPGGVKLPIDKAPILVDDNIDGLGSKLVPVSGKPLTFTLKTRVVNPIAELTLEPFFRIHDSRYMMYWMALTPSTFKAYTDSIAALEKEQMAIQARTVDAVAPGEQQPEVDHSMERRASSTGNLNDFFYRDARGGGFFSYLMKTNKETDLVLAVRYWGAETGNRNFDIYIDDTKLVSESLTGKWNRNAFVQVEYPIPAELLSGKEQVRVRFEAAQGSTAGRVFGVRLLRTHP